MRHVQRFLFPLPDPLQGDPSMSQRARRQEDLPPEHGHSSTEEADRKTVFLQEDARQWAQRAGLEDDPVAHRICACLLIDLWDEVTGGDRQWLPDPPAIREVTLPVRVRRNCRELASLLAKSSWIDVGFRAGGLYTSLLPSQIRARLGAFYTPPALAERLLCLAAAEGVDWSKATVLDPACGGGAFLVPVAHRILADHRVERLPPADQLAELEARLSGIEIDPFAAWMTLTLLRLATHQLALQAGRCLDVRIRVEDALDAVLLSERRFDLVVGNPPYGRVGLDEVKRSAFSRSLYGHANLYGLFLDAALRWRAPQGLIAFVTPTSFLGGKYFNKLRTLLIEEAPPLVVDILEGRTGVFDSVQQETCLTVFGPAAAAGGTTVHHLHLSREGLEVQRSGAFTVSTNGASGRPWLLPRSCEQARLVKLAARAETRLHHLGYKASTGPLVWNRHKQALRDRSSPNTLPLIWAEAVRPNRFDFRYRSRSHAPFFAIGENQGHLRDDHPGVLVQRTTAKEQSRRLIACAIPEDFLEEWGGIVVENHVNVLRPAGADRVTPRAVAAVLNTRVVDQLFRCLSGSVAVSATELHALPLPPPEVFQRIEDVLSDGGTDDDEIERLAASGYGLETGR